MEERPTLPPERGFTEKEYHVVQLRLVSVEAYCNGYMTGGFLSMPAFYSITSYPIVKIS
jgi:hypothetical protein